MVAQQPHNCTSASLRNEPDLQILYNNGFLYDSTMILDVPCDLSKTMATQTWPFTLDYGLGPASPPGGLEGPCGAAQSPGTRAARAC